MEEREGTAAESGTQCHSGTYRYIVTLLFTFWGCSVKALGGGGDKLYNLGTILNFNYVFWS